MCCRVLQCVAVCCSVLQCVMSSHNLYNTFNFHIEFVAACYSVLQCVAVCYSMLKCVEVCCSMLQHAATMEKCSRNDELIRIRLIIATYNMFYGVASVSRID